MGKRFMLMSIEAREHALAWKLAQSPLVDIVYVSPLNHAIGFDPKCVRYPAFNDFQSYADFAVEHSVACVIIGDTSQMQAGATDLFMERGIPVLGAPQASAMLEGEKLFGKAFMHKHGIPTGRYKVCDDPAKVEEFLLDAAYPVVLKADQRITAAKSAMIADNAEQARAACKVIFDAQARLGKAGAPHSQILLEEFISGRELSYLMLMDGTDWTPLLPVRDYKRRNDGDSGPNTGGMGGYAPVPWLTQSMSDKIRSKIVEPTFQGMRAEDLQYRGFLYIGIMIDAQGEPWVLEYNTRLGNPEAQSMLMMLEDDLAEAALRAAAGSVKDMELRWRKGCATSVMIAPHRYPGFVPPKVVPLTFPLPATDDVKCFGGAMAVTSDGQITTRSGSFLCVTAYGTTVTESRQRAYAMATQLNETLQLYLRTDIGLEIDD